MATRTIKSLLKPEEQVVLDAVAASAGHKGPALLAATDGFFHAFFWPPGYGCEQFEIVVPISKAEFANKARLHKLRYATETKAGISREVVRLRKKLVDLRNKQKHPGTGRREAVLECIGESGFECGPEVEIMISLYVLGQLPPSSELCGITAMTVVGGKGKMDVIY